MKLIDVYAKLKALNQMMLRTSDVAVYFNISTTHASKLLARLAASKQLVNIGRNCWVFPDIEPLLLPEFLTSPFPTYISLQTALYYHGMISQIPDKIYAVSLARTKSYRTKLAEISIHHIQPEFFFDFELMGDHSVKLATPEKALLDVLYLSQGKSRFFHSLPELELPKNFKFKKAKEMIQKIPSGRRRALVHEKLMQIFDQKV